MLKKVFLGYSCFSCSERIKGLICKLFDWADDVASYDRQIEIVENPYNIWIAAMKRELYESDKFPSNEDYLVNNSHHFKPLEEVSHFLSQMNLILSEIKWASDLEFL